MTRFARAEGSKSSNKKVVEDGTPWNLLKMGANAKTREGRGNGMKSCGSGVESCGKLKETKASCLEKFASSGNTWCVIDEKPIKSSKKRGEKRKCEEGDQEEPSKKISSSLKISRLHNKFNGDLNAPREKLIDEGKDLEDVDKVIRMEQKKIGETLKKGGKKCLKCRKSGHVLKDCPENVDAEVCFACGSTEHRFKDCKRRGSDKFAFATCFVCKERGHISSLCPDNPCGLYPHGGGCNLCGDVTHFSRDCPKKQKSKSQSKFTLPTLSAYDIEGLPEDNQPSSAVQKPVKKIKVVKF